ncbi:hypothetical protein Golob_003944, partial [Gossypium lobatum]|nr:hypothetical protein [Gossypium lobatum]
GQPTTNLTDQEAALGWPITLSLASSLSVLSPRPLSFFSFEADQWHFDELVWLLKFESRFVRGDQYAVALALLDRGNVVLGVLACPNLPLTSISVAHPHSPNNEVGCLFFAEVGRGTYMQLLDGSSTVKVSAVENPEEASFFESYESAHSMHDLSSLIAQKLGVKAAPIRMDSQVKYGALSRGDGAIYLRFPRNGYREKIWDHAAGSIVVTEAGGVVTDAAGKQLDFSKGKYLDLDTGIIVSNQKLMPLLFDAVRASLAQKSKPQP